MSVVEEELYEEDFDDIVSDHSDGGKTPPPGELSSNPSDAPASVGEEGGKVAAAAAADVLVSTTSAAAAGAEAPEAASVTSLPDKKPVPSPFDDLEEEDLDLMNVVESSTGKLLEKPLESVRPPMVPKENSAGTGGATAAGSAAGVEPFKPRVVSVSDLASADKEEGTVPEPFGKISAVSEGSEMSTETPPPQSQVASREAPAVTFRPRPSPATEIGSPEPPSGLAGEAKSASRSSSGAGIAGDSRGPLPP
ncbi:hypothetical protein T484DRAFT_1776605 [Baffinella frigidus]|nr:hypothetical protein T484DRAFT_1776605 [Cryptophyta sp. CCMP2293]